MCQCQYLQCSRVVGKAPEIIDLWIIWYRLVFINTVISRNKTPYWCRNKTLSERSTLSAGENFSFYIANFSPFYLWNVSLWSYTVKCRFNQHFKTPLISLKNVGKSSIYSEKPRFRTFQATFSKKKTLVKPRCLKQAFDCIVRGLCNSIYKVVLRLVSLILDPELITLEKGKMRE